MLKTETLDSALVVADVRGKIVGVNPRCSEMFGYSSAELVGKDLSVLMPTPYREQHQEFVARFMHTRVQKMIGKARIVTARHQDGTEFQAVLALKMVQNGDTILFHGFMKKLGNAAVDIVINAKGTILECSEGVVRVFGHTVDECVGKNVNMFMEPHVAKHHDAWLANYLETGDSQIVNRIRNVNAMDKQGRPFPISLYVERVAGVEHRFHARIDRIHQRVEAVCTASTNGKFLSVNDNFLPLFGYNKGELIGQNVSMLMPEPYRSQHDSFLERYNRERVSRVLGHGRRQVHGMHKDLSVFPIYIDVNECHAGDDSRRFFTAIITRVTPSAADSPVDLISSVGDYLVCDTLGVGSSAVVKLGRHRLKGTLVALKLQHKNGSHYNEKHIQEEADVLRLVQHPYVAELIDHFDTKEYSCFVLEFVSGGDLCTLLEKNRGPLTEARARVIFRQLVSVTQHIHSRGVVHRDLKLENVLLDSNSDIRLIDFGLSTVCGEDELLRTMCGTPNYAAPELLLAQPYEGRCTDVWSLGVILYCLVCAGFPFKDTQQTVDGTFSTPASLSPSLVDLLTKLLVVDPKKRLTVAEIDRHPWVNEGFSCSPLADLERLAQRAASPGQKAGDDSPASNSGAGGVRSVSNGSGAQRSSVQVTSLSAPLSISSSAARKRRLNEV